MTARRIPWAAVVAFAVLLTVTIGVVAVSQSGSRPLDPRSTGEQGSAALVALLRARQVEVQLVRDDEAAGALADGTSTVLVTDPGLLRPLVLPALRDSGARLVLVAPDQPALDSLDVVADVAAQEPVAGRQPACADPVALRAGVAEIGGVGYRPGAGVTGCYASSGAAAYLAVDSGSVVALGGPEPLTNAGLDQEGNAALALLLLGQRDRLVWLQPDLPPLDAEGTSLTSLLPRQVRDAAWALAAAVVLLAIARARRLGRVVPEPLPVVVRSAETVEGTARLYRAARARDRAAAALRAVQVERLRSALGLAAAPRPDRVVDVVAARSSRSPEEVAGLLYGHAPTDDRALVRLARELDSLAEEVQRP